VSERDLWSAARGSPEPGPRLVEITAGDATAFLDRGDVRYYSVHGREIIRRIYVAVRDVAWQTLPAVVSPAEVHEQDGGGIRVSYEARVAGGDIAFSWTGAIELSASGELAYAITGIAGSGFDYARIGLNILHPPSLAGRPYRAVTRDRVLEGKFPDGVGPQPLRDGEYFPLFPAFSALTASLDGPVDVRFELDGDEFEMEDQRNWLDASYKTYSTPMSLGLRHAEPGDSIAQRVRVRADDRTAAPGARKAARRAGSVELMVDRQHSGGVFPAIGLGMASHGRELAAGEADLLAALRLSHLRADVRLSRGDADEVVARAAAAALQCRCGLELAVFLDAVSPGELGRLGTIAREPGAQLRRLLVFCEHELVTSPGVLAAARDAAGAGVPVFGGTNLYFAELNRDRPDPAAADGFAFSANPQVHSADDRSMTEAPASFADVLLTGRGFLAARPMAVSPVTLLPRFNADAAGAGTAGTGDPPPADHRQASLLCAAFTALAAKHLAGGEAAAATFYETTGELGIIAPAAGRSSRPVMLGATAVPPGAAFPVYHVISACSRWSGLPACRVTSSDPLSADGAACEVDGRLQVLIANATPGELPARINGLGSAAGTIRTLDASSVSASWAAGRRSSSFSPPREITGSTAAIELGPYAVAFIDIGPE
jgi:hypothetical protein